MITRWCTTLFVLAMSLVIFGCGGGSTATENAGDINAPQLTDKGDIDLSARGTSDLDYPYVDPTPGDKQCWDLIAGQNMYAGEVCLWNDGETLFVEYDLDNGFEMHEAHVYVGDEPPSKGAPGQFPYHMDFDPPVDYYLFEIDLDWAGKSRIYVATHAAAGNETLWGGRWNDGDPTYQYSWGKKWGGYFDMCVAPVPDLSDETFTYRTFGGAETFWDAVFEDVEPVLPPGSFGAYGGGPASYTGNALYHAWCIDRNHGMFSNFDYDVVLVSSYDPNIADPCDDQHLPILSNGNLDFVNFMINQRYNPDPGGPWDVVWNGGYRNQMQDAIWYFTNGSPIGAGTIAEGMIEYAIANGDNYVPCTGDWYGIIALADPVDCNHGVNFRAQMNIIEVDP